MAEEAQEAPAASDNSGGDAPQEQECPKCEICVPGLPGWMATFSDLVTLLLTFFVLLLSFAKTETAKYEAALGSVRNAFGGNVFKQGEVLQPGKSPDDSPEMVDAQQPIRPFPIEFLTMEGVLEQHEINRGSTEELNSMRPILRENNLDENVEVYEMTEGIKIRVKDKIYFNLGTVEVNKISRAVLDRMTTLLKENDDWTLFIEAHAAKGEYSKDGKFDSFALSAKRAEVVTRGFVKNGVRPDRVTTVFYGDTRPDEAFANATDSTQKMNARVEFILRKTDLRTKGHKVDAR